MRAVAHIGHRVVSPTTHPFDPGERLRRGFTGDRGLESVLTQIAPHRPPIVSTGLDHLHSHVTLTLATSPNLAPAWHSRPTKQGHGIRS
ncbi:hypothetical protein Rwratislav_11528 [Rhodococcus wratislaviensis IFP 2016]|nr:hypothetical protein Rwratislav_11528 [Rhodococcus wratislaviensis IFP 2016]